MNSMDFDWTEVRTFLSVAREGSYSGAARALGLSQPTIRRHVESLSERLKVDLFRRDQSGAKLTEDGTRLLAAAEAMADAAARLSLGADSLAGEVSGTVRITASHVFSHYVLPKLISDIRKRHPAIQVELVASDITDNLLYREADLAIRMYRPEQLDLVTRKIGDLPLGIYAAKSSVAQMSDRLPKDGPVALEALKEMGFVGYDSSELLIRGLSAVGLAMTREDFPVRCDMQPVYWELVRAGCGIGAALRLLGDHDPAVVNLPVGVALPNLPVWLATPATIRKVPRVDLVWNLLADALGKLATIGGVSAT